MFIVVPSPHPVGPVKGAYALANVMVLSRKVTLVYLKPGPGVNASLHPEVAQISLASFTGWRRKFAEYKKLLDSAGGRSCVASISFCFSSDIINRFCRGSAITCASVRGNLPKNYRMDYGFPGIILSFLHLTLLGGFDHIVAMNSPMASQVRFYARKQPAVITNFLDESDLERYRLKCNGATVLQFVFVGSLTERKQPLAIVKAISILKADGHSVKLDMVGDGPLMQSVRTEVSRLGLEEDIKLHGQTANPYKLLAAASAMVLPSLSEGVSRAAMEALFLGVPCVLRNVDANNELINCGQNGALFSNEDELPMAMLAAARIGQDQPERRSLLPEKFRQHFAANRYLALMESAHG